MGLSRHKRDWDDLGKMDARWAIMSDPTKQHGQWDNEEFFLTGEREVAHVMEVAAELGVPKGREQALDFGCGIGRVTRALARSFDHCDAVDVSEHMIAQARELNSAYDNCTFLVNDRPDLTLFRNDTFDVIYSSHVLQHIPGKQVIEGYVAEFVRTLKPGGLLAFLLPSRIHMRNRLQGRRRVYGALRAMGVNPEFLYTHLGLHPIRMSAVAEQEMVALLERLGARVRRIERSTSPGYAMRTYYATK